MKIQTKNKRKEQLQVGEEEFRQDSEHESEEELNSSIEREEFDIENMYNGGGAGRGRNGNGNQGNPGTQMRWSIQNINKFHGGKGEDPDHHISEFEDVFAGFRKFSS